VESGHYRPPRRYIGNLVRTGETVSLNARTCIENALRAPSLALRAVVSVRQSSGDKTNEQDHRRLPGGLNPAYRRGRRRSLVLAAWDIAQSTARGSRCCCSSGCARCSACARYSGCARPRRRARYTSESSLYFRQILLRAANSANSFSAPSACNPGSTRTLNPGLKPWQGCAPRGYVRNGSTADLSRICRASERRHSWSLSTSFRCLPGLLLGKQRSYLALLPSRR
jgi:hypothetical protein